MLEWNFLLKYNLSMRLRLFECVTIRVKASQRVNLVFVLIITVTYLVYKSVKKFYLLMKLYNWRINNLKVRLPYEYFHNKQIIVDSYLKIETKYTFLSYIIKFIRDLILIWLYLIYNIGRWRFLCCFIIDQLKKIVVNTFSWKFKISWIALDESTPQRFLRIALIRSYPVLGTFPLILKKPRIANILKRLINSWLDKAFPKQLLHFSLPLTAQRTVEEKIKAHRICVSQTNHPLELVEHPFDSPFRGRSKLRWGALLNCKTKEPSKVLTFIYKVL